MAVVIAASSGERTTLPSVEQARQDFDAALAAPARLADDEQAQLRAALGVS